MNNCYFPELFNFIAIFRITFTKQVFQIEVAHARSARALLLLFNIFVDAFEKLQKHLTLYEGNFQF